MFFLKMSNVNLCSGVIKTKSNMDFLAKIIDGLDKTTTGAKRLLLSGPKSGRPIKFQNINL